MAKNKKRRATDRRASQAKPARETENATHTPLVEAVTAQAGDDQVDNGDRLDELGGGSTRDTELQETARGEAGEETHDMRALGESCVELLNQTAGWASEASDGSESFPDFDLNVQGEDSELDQHNAPKPQDVQAPAEPTQDTISSSPTPQSHTTAPKTPPSSSPLRHPVRNLPKLPGIRPSTLDRIITQSPRTKLNAIPEASPDPRASFSSTISNNTDAADSPTIPLSRQNSNAASITSEDSTYSRSSSFALAFGRRLPATTSSSRKSSAISASPVTPTHSPHLTSSPHLTNSRPGIPRYDSFDSFGDPFYDSPSSLHRRTRLTRLRTNESIQSDVTSASTRLQAAAKATEGRRWRAVGLDYTVQGFLLPAKYTLHPVLRLETREVRVFDAEEVRAYVAEIAQQVVEGEGEEESDSLSLPEVALPFEVEMKVVSRLEMALTRQHLTLALNAVLPHAYNREWGKVRRIAEDASVFTAGYGYMDLTGRVRFWKARATAAATAGGVEGAGGRMRVVEEVVWAMGEMTLETEGETEAEKRGEPRELEMAKALLGLLVRGVVVRDCDAVVVGARPHERDDAKERKCSVCEYTRKPKLAAGLSEEERALMRGVLDQERQSAESQVEIGTSIHHAAQHRELARLLTRLEEEQVGSTPEIGSTSTWKGASFEIDAGIDYAPPDEAYAGAEDG